MSGLLPRQKRHTMPRYDKSEKADQQPFPRPAADKIKTNQNNACSQQKTPKKPKCRLLRRNTLLNRPPKSAKEYRAKQNARRQN